MRRNVTLLLFTALALSMLEVSCTQELEIRQGIGSETYYTEIISDGSTSRVELEGGCTVWTEGDLLSVFRSSVNEKYRFDGQTGDVRGSISKNDDTEPGTAFSKSYAVYPYSAGTASAEEGTVNYTFPSVQEYKQGSYALGANVMIASTDGALDDRLNFHNVCGYIKLRIYGSKACVLQSIRIYGNNEEKISGPSSIDAETYVVAMQPSATKDITLNFTGGFPLENESTDFWIAIPPVTFTGGFTVELTTDTGKSKNRSTANEVQIERNHAVPMEAFTPNTVTEVEKVFVLYGDSITKQVVRTELQALLDADSGESIGEDGFSIVRNHWKVVLAGVSGERPIQISARQGGVPVYIRGGFTIPASGSVTVGGLYSTWNEQAELNMSPSTSVVFNWGAEDTHSTHTGCSNPFLVNGVECTYNGSTLTRVTAGEPVVCEGEDFGGEKWVRVYPYAAWKYRDAYFSTYQGTNGVYNKEPSEGGNTYEVLSRFYDAETEYSTSKKHIIVGYHNPRWTQNCTNYFKSKYGVQYYDMKEIMLSRYEEIADILGVPLSAEDIERIEGGSLPLAWQATNDLIHFTMPLGYYAYAVCVYLKMKEQGWI